MSHDPISSGSPAGAPHAPNYRNHRDRAPGGPPTRLKVIAIVGLVLGIISVIGNTLEVVTFGTWLPDTRAQTTAPVVSPMQSAPLPRQLPQSPPATELQRSRREMMGVDGLSALQRRDLISRLELRRKIPTDFASALDVLLCEVGSKIVVAVYGNFEANIERRFTEVAVSTDGTTPTLHLKTANGDVELTHTAGSFKPTTGEPISVEETSLGYWIVRRGSVTAMSNIAVAKVMAPLPSIQAAAFHAAVAQGGPGLGHLIAVPTHLGKSGAYQFDFTNNQVLRIDVQGNAVWNGAAAADTSLVNRAPADALPSSSPPQKPGLLYGQVLTLIGIYVLGVGDDIVLIIASRKILRVSFDARRWIMGYAIYELLGTSLASAFVYRWAAEILVHLAGAPRPELVAAYQVSIVANVILVFAWVLTILVVARTRVSREFWAAINPQAARSTTV